MPQVHPLAVQNAGLMQLHVLLLAAVPSESVILLQWIQMVSPMISLKSIYPFVQSQSADNNLLSIH
jgi:hypothetical protein